MRVPARCPRCGARLEPEQRNCPGCPMSFPEDDEGVNHPLRGGRWAVFVAPAAFLLAMSAVIWTLASGFFRLAEESAKAPLAPARAVERRVTPPPPVHEAPELVPGPPSVDPGSPEVVEETAPRRPAPKEWRLRGAIYDLVTLAPVPGARLILADDAAGRRIETRSDAKGRWRTVVPPAVGSGYQVMILKAGYASSYASPAYGEVRAMEPERREELARELAASLHAPTALRTDDPEPLVTDFYLAPRR